MVEVFISSAAEPPFIRRLFIEAVKSSWSHIPGAVTVHDHKRWDHRHQWAESQSVFPFYVLADDDCEPCPWLDVRAIVKLFHDNPEYQTIALSNILDSSNKAWEGIETPLVEYHSVGGIRFVRKGIVTEFLPGFTGCDSEYYDMVKKCGYKQGIATEFSFLHLGHWHSMWNKKAVR